VLKVERPDGEILWEADPPEQRQVLEPGLAFLVTDALREALARGTGTAARGAGFRGPAAGKTGTTNDGTDTWFVGFTPDVVAAVWIGFDRPRPIVPQATGGRVAAPVWGRVMARLYQGRPLPRPWGAPGGVFQASVDPGSGLILAEGCQPLSGPAYREYFMRGTSPPAVCPSRGMPVEMMADLEMALPDDDEALDLSTELPPELREPLPIAEELEEEAPAPADEGDAPAGETRPATPSPLPEPGPDPTPRPLPTASPAPEPERTPPPTPVPTPVPAPEPTPPPG
jgi:membrane peptidoglycan carboxypeptidase